MTETALPSIAAPPRRRTRATSSWRARSGATLARARDRRGLRRRPARADGRAGERRAARRRRSHRRHSRSAGQGTRSPTGLHRTSSSFANMHERKQAFTDLADGFVTLPGGVGTMDELWEAVSWAQLGYHAKPVGLLNAFGYYDGLIAFNRHMAEVGFVRPAHRGIVIDEVESGGPARTHGRITRPHTADLRRCRPRTTVRCRDACLRVREPRGWSPRSICAQTPRQVGGGTRTGGAGGQARESRSRAASKSFCAGQQAVRQRDARTSLAALCLVPALRRHRRRAGPSAASVLKLDDASDASDRVQAIRILTAPRAATASRPPNWPSTPSARSPPNAA